MLKPQYKLYLTFLPIFTVLCYFPGLWGDFIFDDIPNIADNESIRISHLSPPELNQAAFSSTSSSILKRPIAMLSFALNHYLTGLDPFYFKITNLILHIVTGLSLFLLTYLILTAYRNQINQDLPEKNIFWISLIVSAIWLLHPIHITSVLYVVQRMNILSTLFVVWALISYTWGRLHISNRKVAVTCIIIAPMIYTVMAILSKENGLLAPLFMLIVELFIFKRATETKSSRILIYGFFSGSIILPAVVLAIYWINHPTWLFTGYVLQDFTLLDRLLTETRVLWSYIYLIILPIPNNFALFHDDITISTGIFSPVSTLFSIFGILTLLFIVFRFKSNAPIFSFSILFFLIGHSMESTIFPLEIMYEHRNYLPTFGLVFLLVFYSFYPFKNIKTIKISRILIAVFIIATGLITFGRAFNWKNEATLAIAESIHHPNSPRSNYEVGRIYAVLSDGDRNNQSQLYLLAKKHFEKSIELSPGNTTGLFGLITLNFSKDIPLDEKWLTELRYRLQHYAYKSSNLSALRTLLHCQKNRRCELTNDEFLSLIYASLENTNLVGKRKADVLSIAADFHINVTQQYIDAIAYAKLAVDTVPYLIPYRINLIKILIALKQKDVAEKELNTARRTDKFNKFTNKLDNLEYQIKTLTH